MSPTAHHYIKLLTLYNKLKLMSTALNHRSSCRVEDAKYFLSLSFSCPFSYVMFNVLVEWCTPIGGSGARAMKNNRIVLFIGLYYQLNYLWSVFSANFSRISQIDKKLNQNKALKRRRNLYTKVAANGSRVQSLHLCLSLCLSPMFTLYVLL